MDNTEKTEITSDKLEELYNGLKTEEKAFVDNYLINGFNATQAIRTAYPNVHNTDGAARVAGFKRLHSNSVKIFLDAYFKLQRENRERKVDKLCDELETIAFGDTKQFKDAALKVKAIDILSKYYGMQENKLDITSGGEKLKLEIKYE